MHTALQPIKDVQNLAKSFIHAQSMIGADKIAVPGEKATPEQVAEFHRKLGWPEKPEAYKFDEKLIPDGLVPDKARMVKTVQSIMHKHHISEKAATGVYQEYVASMVEDAKAAKEADVKIQQDWVESIKKEYGPAFEQNVAIGTAALKKFGGEGVTKVLKATGLGSNPDVVRMFVAIGKGLMDGKIVDGAGNPMGGILAPSEAKAKIAELKGSTEFIKKLYNKTEIGHEQAVKEWDELHKTAFPE